MLWMQPSNRHLNHHHLWPSEVDNQQWGFQCWFFFMLFKNILIHYDKVLSILQFLTSSIAAGKLDALLQSNSLQDQYTKKEIEGNGNGPVRVITHVLMWTVHKLLKVFTAPSCTWLCSTWFQVSSHPVPFTAPEQWVLYIYVVKQLSSIFAIH